MPKQIPMIEKREWLKEYDDVNLQQKLLRIENAL